MILFIVPVGAMSPVRSISAYGTEGRFQPWAKMMAVMCGIPALLPWVVMGGFFP